MWRSLSGRDRDAGGGGRLAAALVEVASLLRAGAAPADAWSLVLGSPVPDRVPTAAQLSVMTGGERAARRARGSPGPSLHAVIVAARVADELGAPLADVLEQVAAAIAAQAEAAADAEAALAGPRSSARVLAWLPLFGVVLGTVLGANPARVLLGGGLGSAAGALGVMLILVGRWWSGALLRRAARAGDRAGDAA
ncbi:MAG TPA: type II secretion system F family protein [Cellulomonas sp.]